MCKAIGCENVNLEGVYYLNTQEIKTIYREFALNFFDDDLYSTIFPSTSSRQWALPYLFRHYLKAIGPYCHFIADSEDLNCVVMVYDSTKGNQAVYKLRFFIMAIAMIPVAFGVQSIKNLRHAYDCLDMFSSKWTKEFVNGDYYHLDLIYTKKEKRNQGLAQQLIKKIIDDAQAKSFDLTLETHHKDNLYLYDKLGFHLMGTITHEEYGLAQYCMLLKASEE